MHSVPKDHGFAERQPGLGTIPIHEFVDRVPVAALSIGAGKAVEDSGFRDFEVWQPQHRFRGPSFCIALMICFITRGLQRHGLIMHLLTLSSVRVTNES